MTAAARLTFFNPYVMRAVRAAATPRTARFARHRGTFARRRGKAVEMPPLPPSDKAWPLNPPSITAQAEAERTTIEQSPETETPKDSIGATTAPDESDPDKTRQTSPTPSEESSDTASQPKEKEDPQQERTKKAREEAKQSGPLEAVLSMPSAEDIARQTPTMTPPLYVHHFDTYSLVKQLVEGGFSHAQATTAMKTVRTLLAQNLDVAQASLVSKSDVENETYLFSAACSELSTEIRNNRRLEEEQLRQQRTHLQHEVDILTQSLNQEVYTLNDNVRGMFNDRKMAVREEQKVVESAIQQINYKISIMLSSDAKSEIEAVRWILIRRSVLGILFMAVLTLGTLRYATYVGHERQKEVERKKKEDEERRLNAGKQDRSSAADAAVILAAS